MCSIFMLYTSNMSHKPFDQDEKVELTDSSVKKEKIAAPRGVPDYLPPVSEKIAAIRRVFLEEADNAAYGVVELPIFEHTELFLRGVGESTDIVNKEMYTFLDKSDRSVTLRPEGTAGVMRAIIEHGLDKGALPVKLSYYGPIFRYENPQAGRLRQFQTVGIEAVGSDDPLLDVETISIAARGLEKLGVQDYRIEINSLGDVESRLRHRKDLIDFLDTLNLDEPTRARAHMNPLRVLDDKRPEIQEMTAKAPVLLDYLSSTSREHFEYVQKGLERVGISYTVNARLVRGLDYYNKTAFEFVHNSFGNGMVLGGGGRYDGLLAQLGGSHLSGVGFGMGLERILLALEQEETEIHTPSSCEVFAVPIGVQAKYYLLEIIHRLRSQGIRSDIAYGDKSVKAGMKAADRSGAQLALIVGENELNEKVISVKNLADGTTTTVDESEIETYIKNVR